MKKIISLILIFISLFASAQTPYFVKSNDTISIQKGLYANRPINEPLILYYCTDTHDWYYSDGVTSKGFGGGVTDYTALSNLPTIPTTLPASDVYSWAKAATKPAYSWSEISSVPTALSAFTNDLGNYGGFVTGTPWTSAGYLTSYNETDPLVYTWAKATVKPTYSYTEVGAAASTHTHATTDITGTAVVTNDSRLTDARTPTAHNQAESTITFSNITTGNATTANHGYLPTLSNNSAQFLNGTGTYSTPTMGAPTIADFATGVRQQPIIYTDFMAGAGAATVEAEMELDYAVIASGTQAKVAGEANHPGILSTTSSTTTNSGGYCVSEATSILISGGETFEIIFQDRVASNTNTTIRFGFHDATTSTDAVDGCYFEIPSGSLAVVGKTSSNSSRSTSATVYTITASTWYRAKVTVNSGATSVNFSIYSDAGSLLGSQDVATNIPTGAGRNCGQGFVATNVGTSAILLAYWDFMSFYYTTRTLTR
jgi:hypothetical protein